MDESIIIAHLSDLHCDSKDAWNDSFVSILRCLKKINPHIIVITGDLVDTPTKKNFKTLKANFEELKKEPSFRENLHIMVVPGNHDYFVYGNRIVNIFNYWYYFKRKKLFQEYIKHFIAPCNDYNDVLASILINFRIGIFPLDSNRSSIKYASAEGGIKNPLKKMQSIDDSFIEICQYENIDFSKIKKIALLHHHPIPIATAHKEEFFEKFITLRNSYQFLKACRSFDIDIVLHGHKHMSNLTNCTYFNNDSQQDITICSCDTSGKYNAKEKEIKVLEIHPSGSVDVNRFTLSQHECDFDIAGRKPLPTTYYGDVRKKLNTCFSSYENLAACPIKNIRNKTKIISLDEFGKAYVSISLSRITWRDNLDIRDKKIEERIRADLGRVTGGFYEFCQCPITGDGEASSWRNPLSVEGVHPKPSSPEAFNKFFYPSNPLGGEGHDCFTLEYYLSSGFCLTTWEHAERYKKWNPKIPPQEIATISVNYPTDFLELIVQFPPDFFPPVKNVYLEATEKENIEVDPSLKLLYGEIPPHKQETDFLNFKGAVRIRPEISEIAVIIKYPQPHLEYSLRWSLPEHDYRRIDISSNNERLNSKLAKSLIQRNFSTRTDKLYSELNSFLEKSIFPTVKISVFLLIYNNTEKFLEVTRSPEEFRHRIVGKIIIGRGPAGLAFRLRGALFWQIEGGASQTDSIHIYPVEEVIKDYRPVKVFAMPLCYPTFISSEDGKIGYKDRYICPAWGCLSVTSDEENSFQQLSAIEDKEKRGEELIKLYKEINLWLREYMYSNFSDLIVQNES